MSIDTNNMIGHLGSSSGLGANQKLGQKDFLRLMVAQFKNQDPTNPKANGDFLAQLAQFSINDGIGKMQDSIANLTNAVQSNQALQASSLVGRKVLVNSDIVKLDENNHAKMVVEVPAPVSNMTAFIVSPTGELVRQIPLGTQNAGFTDVLWDGLDQKGEQVKPGNYLMKVSAAYEGQEVALKTLSLANVDSVSLGQNGEGIKLNIAGVGPMSLQEVKQITN